VVREDETISNHVTPIIDICPFSLCRHYINLLHNSHSPLGIKYPLLLQNLCKHRNSGIDRVGNDQDESFGTSVGDGFGESGTDTSVDLWKRGGEGRGMRLTGLRLGYWVLGRMLVVREI